MLEVFKIWSEGFSATGQRGIAILHGEVAAKTFKEACDKLAEQDPEFKAYYNADRGLYWGCRLFADETSARKTYG